MAMMQPGLRARKKQATATALQQSAIELFLARGYDETTVQDITDVAGVSQRTFFRYYATKDAVLLTEHTRREDDLRAFLATRPDEPIGATARALIAHLAEDISERQELVKVQTQVFFSVPSLADRFAGHHDRLAMIVAEHLAGRLGVAHDADARPRLVANQVIRSWTTAILLWLTAGMTGDLPAMAEETLTIARRDPALVDAD
ncbi:TetR family transcriptional regulator [Iamia sp.]|uniref:TetR family transcriptional regulator n=1 Tax=Iamia sp. TaxID=2722710 RepID=UPI002B78F79D|nr:TetR family transcriptional regulator [Iamia sp.]HXH58397.1 TetR family transcriptional regulator [Iamia sp.]